jgi:DNA polymerase III subunit delta'
MNLDPLKQTVLFGHDHQLLKLINLYLKNKLPNKILLSGEKGIGKCTLAYHLINFILSTNEKYPYDLKKLKINNENRSFKLMQNKSNPNFILVDVAEEKKNIDINQIRNLILTLNKSSFNLKPRFVLMDNIELLNTNSVNAMLKFLEEPNDNINFILINNNKKVLSTLKSRCLNFKVSLTLDKIIEITNKLMEVNFKDLLNDELITNYITPGKILKIVDFANNNDIDLKDVNLKKFISQIIMDKKYKKDSSIKDLIYTLMEIYFRNNTSVKNGKLIGLYNYFLKKINDTKVFNLDEESLFIEFEDRVLNG